MRIATGYPSMSGTSRIAAIVASSAAIRSRPAAVDEVAPRGRLRSAPVVLDYTVCNHIHLLLREQGGDEIAASMELIEGPTAQPFQGHTSTSRDRPRGSRPGKRLPSLRPGVSIA